MFLTYGFTLPAENVVNALREAEIFNNKNVFVEKKLTIHPPH